MATTNRNGVNLASLGTRVHLVEEKLKHLDPNSGGGDPGDLETRLEAAEALLQRMWTITFNTAATEYDGTGFHPTPSENDTVFDPPSFGGPSLVRAIFGATAGQQATQHLLDAMAGDGLVQRIQAIEFELGQIADTLADHASRITALENA